MNNVIVFNLNGLVSDEALEQFRQKKIKEFREGIVVNDERVKDVTMVHISELGAEFTLDIVARNTMEQLYCAEGDQNEE